MFTMPFRILRDIKKTVRESPLDGLVLILAARAGDRLLAVYLDDKLPRHTFSAWEVKPLSEVRDEDWLTFDGLCVAYEVLSLVFPSLQTCSPYFYPIDRLFKEVGKPSLLDRVELARWLLAQNDLFHHRIEDLVALLLPLWMQSKPPKNGSVGLVVSLTNLPSYLDGDAGPSWLSVDDLGRLGGEGGWVLTFSEAQMLLPPEVHVTDWRSILNRGSFKNLYRQGLFALARTLWEKGREQDRDAVQDAAWELAIEYWLPHWLANDVLAIQPIGDFDAFLSEGKMLILGRAPVLLKDASFRITWNDFQKERFPKNTGRTWFALQPLNERMQMRGIEKIAALELIWIRSGRLASLAQALLGLAESLREGEIGRYWPLPRRELAWLTLRGLFLATFSDPWARSWGGRYGITLQKTYRLLGDVLLLAEQQSVEAEQPMFALLRRWYGIVGQTGDNFERQWHEVRQLSAALSSEQGNPDLTLIQKFIKLMDQPEQNPGWQSKEQTNEQTAAGAFTRLFRSPPPLVSNQFLSAVRDWWRIHRKIQQAAQQFERPKLEDVEGWFKELRLLDCCLCGLRHEATILRYFIDKDIRILERLRAALRGQVVLQVRLLTDPLLLGEWTNLIVEIWNVGERDAHGLEVELGCSDPMALEVNRPLSQGLSLLPARSNNEEHRLAWPVRIMRNSVTFWLTCEYLEGEEKRTVQFPLSIHLLRRPGKGQAPQGGNRFQAGIAVSGEKFYGRRDELKQMFNFLLGSTNQPVLLRGPRRIGKTSVLAQIAYLLERAGALQRLLGFSPEAEAKIRRYRPIQVSLQGIREKEDISSWLFALYRRMAEVAGETAEESLRDEFRYNGFEGFKKSLRYYLLPRVPELYWLILLDEWDEQRHIRKLGPNLREIMQSREFDRLYWIFASTWMLSEEAGRFGSPFYNQCYNIELTQMRWDEARQMVVQISREMNVEWEGAALVKILDQTALHPYLIQRVGQDVITRLANAKPPSNFVTLEVLDGVLDDLVHSQRDPTSPFAFLWPQRISAPSQGEGESEARLSWLGRMILLTLHEAERPLSSIEIYNSLGKHFARRNWKFPGTSLEDEVGENLIRLERIFDVLKEVNGVYDFSIPLARAWFYQGVQQIIDPWEMAWKGLKEEHLVQ